jgi:FeS assembly SUF system regulator
MLRVQKLTDHGIHIMVYLARHKDVRNARQASEATRVPAPTTEKVLKRLARAGLLVSQRGVSGGYVLARPAEELSVADIVEAIEGPFGLTQCSNPASAPCESEDDCPIRPHWAAINQAVHDALDLVSLSDIADGRDKELTVLSPETAHSEEV